MMNVGRIWDECWDQCGDSFTVVTSSHAHFQEHDLRSRAFATMNATMFLLEIIHS